MLASSFTTNHYLFCVLYGIYGAGVTGIINIPIIWACWGFYPQRIGMITSLGLAGYSLGPMVFGFLWTMMINPHNDSPHKSHDGNADSGLFGHEVYDKVPASIRWAALIYVVIATLGTSIIWNKGLTNGRKGVGKSLKLKDVIKQKNFWLLLGWVLFLFCPYAFTFTNYKVAAISKIKNDHFFAFLGSAGFLSACLARLGCGFLVDKYGWKRLAMISASVQTIINATIYYSMEIEELYAILVIIEFMCGSNAYLLLVMACKEIYPKDSWIVSFPGSGITLAVFLLYLMQLFISPTIGYEFTFDILAGMAFLSLILIYYTQNPSANAQADISLLSVEPSLSEAKTENSLLPKTLS
ncbi:unnamed protein product [Blepharisma stoltei]|uniref:Uncharacterized protein n=1 Tax=Blepharisma stoltei TaxID=1481888 RepID=A0AAU9IYL9_9CILI|nr:unnamed protein product [Blepharisma stoltei]